VFDEILVDVLNSFGAATENALVANIRETSQN
jgi:hypothetical protein